MRSPLVGPAYTAWSKDLANNRCINLYLESVAGADGAAPAALYGCPGLDLALTFATSPVRAAVNIAGTVYAIAGNKAYSVTSALVATQLGTIGTGTGPAYILWNATSSALPNQIGFFDSSGLWVYTPATGTFSAVALPFNPALGVPCYLEGFAVVSQPGTFNIWQSNVNDLTTWNALNFTTEDGNAEPVVALVSIHNQFIAFKQYSFTPYVNAGLNGFVFQRLPGIFPDVGVAAVGSVFTFADAVYWVGHTQGSAPRIYRSAGNEVEPISTPAIDNAIQAYSTVTDAIAYGYSQNGHDFAVFSFPSGNETWVFDLTESRRLKAPMWHQRALFSGTKGFYLYPGSCAVQMAGQVYLGDYTSGNLYKLNLNSYTDNGSPRKWLRSWRALQGPAVYQTTKCNYLDLQMETGFGVGASANPQVVLRQSFDGGNTWSNERYQPAGKLGATLQTVQFTRLGSTRRGLNSDRVFELSSTDAFKVALMGADVG